MRDSTARRLEPLEPQKTFRLQTRASLSCWGRHALRGQNVRWMREAENARFGHLVGAIAVCLTCGDIVLVSGTVLCEGGQSRFLTHRLTQGELRAIVKQRAKTITEILAILALD